MELRRVARAAARFAYVGTKDYVDNHPDVAVRLAFVSFVTFQAASVLYAVAITRAFSQGRTRRRALTADCSKEMS